MHIPTARSSRTQCDPHHSGNFPGLEEEEKAGEGWHASIKLPPVYVRCHVIGQFHPYNHAILHFLKGGQGKRGYGEEEG